MVISPLEVNFVHKQILPQFAELANRNNALFASVKSRLSANNMSVKLYFKYRKQTKGIETMSPKELLYIEDSLGHTQYLMTQCRDAANQLTDPALKQQAQQLVNANQKLFTQFYNLV
jgi:hypothetical protein